MGGADRVKRVIRWIEYLEETAFLALIVGLIAWSLVSWLT